MAIVLLDGTSSGVATVTVSTLPCIRRFGATSNGVATVTSPFARLVGLAGEADGETCLEAAAVVNVVINTRPLFPFAPDWANQIAQKFSYNLNEKLLGFSTPRFEQLQQDTAQGFSFQLWRDDEPAIADFDLWTSLLQGRLNGFWIVSPFEHLEIVAGVDNLSFLIKDQGLRDVVADQTSAYLLFWQDSPVARRVAQIATVTENMDGNELVALTAALDVPIDETWCAARLVYVRLVDDTEAAEFDGDNRALRTVKVVELPTEYASIETGTQPVWLYEFWILANGTYVYWRFTALNEDIVSAGSTFTSSPIEHASLSRGMKASKEDVQLQTWFDANNPVTQFIPFSLSAPLWVRIYETTYAAPSTRTLKFTGLVSEVDADGKLLTAKCSSILDALGRRFPRMLIQPICNYFVYSTPCGVDKTQYQAHVTLFELAGVYAVVDQSSVDTPDRFTNAAANDFALGWIQTGTGQQFEIRSILASTVVSGGKIVLTLDKPFIYAVAAQAATMYLGCDGSKDTCKTKFGNFKRWGGHGYVPAQNPTITEHVVESHGTKK
ncbi:MAG: baseplate hub domain-containing protein [Limisphaerales bacterium]